MQARGQLVLTRRAGEAVLIVDGVRVTVLEVQRSQVRFGIEAPQEVPVHREEVLARQAGQGGGTMKEQRVTRAQDGHGARYG